MTEVYAGKGAADMSVATESTFKSTSTNSIKEVSIQKSGAILITYQSSVAPEGANKLSIVPVNQAAADDVKPVDLSNKQEQPWAGVWSCKSPETTLPAKLLPADCK